MNVSLTPELEQYVSAKVESGRYNSASEVVREAFMERLLLSNHSSNSEDCQSSLSLPGDSERWGKSFRASQPS